ncbi:rho guanine nucleotide exchange factor 11-like [Geospiza fortis]|uniref:Rho guanine nucleotide exchange factor 11-like n=1 Tax=Geospiza fortis TaxID=48883 RepID=A0A8N5F3A3_GEOFO|nr:rho guanine nucleotide exchange factor 11-like [Geospiza fortis]
MELGMDGDGYGKISRNDPGMELGMDLGMDWDGDGNDAGMELGMDMGMDTGMDRDGYGKISGNDLGMELGIDTGMDWDGDGNDGSGRPQIIGPEEDCEPGNGSNESDSVFQDLGILKSRPAHLGVFLRFLFSQADPTPLLFHLCSEVCCQQSPRPCRALGRDIWNVFLDRAAPLRVKLPEQLLAEIELRLRSGDELRPALLEAQELVIPEIQEQLQDYRWEPPNPGETPIPAIPGAPRPVLGQNLRKTPDFGVCASQSCSFLLFPSRA